MVNLERSLERRIVRLERWNRLLGAAVAGLVLLGLAAAAGSGEERRAGSFQVTDRSGRVRAELGLRDGEVGLFLVDEEGRDRLSATHGAEGTGLFLHDEAGTIRVGVAQWAHGGGGVALHGPESKGAAVLYLKDGGSLRLFDADGTVTDRWPAAPPEPRD